MARQKSRSALRRTRKVSQTVSLAFFCAGILMAGSVMRPIPKDLFFQMSPLVAIVTFASTGMLVPGFPVAAALVAATLIFGRFFCGWVCPMGALIDLTEWIFQKKTGKKKSIVSNPEKFSQFKFGTLLVVLAASIASVQWIYFFDPMVIMTRFVGMVLMPVQRAVTQSSPFTVLNADQFVLFVIAILLLSAVASRFWCRFVCPLGGFFGLVGRFSTFDFFQDGCKGCPQCERSCPTGAITGPRSQDFRSEECIRCFNCLDACPRKVRTYTLRFHKPQRLHQSLMPRRTFLAWVAGGLAGSTFMVSRASGQPNQKALLRPPFAADEPTFLNLCLRCQACVNVCPSNALQPIFMQSGIYGLWSPGLMPVVGACQTDCNRCSQVCPTGAIGKFNRRSKYTLKMGTAHLIKSRCISHADRKACGKCIPKCPTGAISFYEDQNDGQMMKVPVGVDFLLCVGCGICENICNHQALGDPALKVTARGRNQASGVNTDQMMKRIANQTRRKDHAG